MWVESVLPDRPCHGRTDALMHRALSRAVVDAVLTTPAGPQDRSMIAGNPTLPPDVVRLLAADPDPEIRAEIAGRTDLGPAERRTLATDPVPDVRRTVARHPDLGPEERQALATDPDPGVRLAAGVDGPAAGAQRGCHPTFVHVAYRLAVLPLRQLRFPLGYVPRSLCVIRRIHSSSYPLGRYDAPHGGIR